MKESIEIKQWHVYSASAESGDYTLEMCMTGLDKKCASSVFSKTRSSSAAMMTEVSGIKKILPESQICDFDFDLCGYSMNGIEGDAISTIHVTSEDRFSYASFEAVGCTFESSVGLSLLVERVLGCFRPSEFSVSLHGNDLKDFKTISVNAYTVKETNFEDLGEGGSMMYYKFTSSSGSPRSTLNEYWSEYEDEEVTNK